MIALHPREGAKGRAVALALLFLAMAAFLGGWLLLHGPWQRGWRDWLVLGGAAVLMLVGAREALATVFGGTPRVLMDEATLTVILPRRRWRAGWHEIADIVAHDVPPAQRDVNNFNRVELRLKTPSGVPLVWVTIPDIFTIGRDELAATLQRRHAEALRHPDPGQATQLGTAAAAIRARDGALFRLAAAVVLGPLVLLGLILLGRNG